VADGNLRNVYVSVSSTTGTGNRQLAVLTFADLRQGGPARLLDVGENTGVRLAYNRPTHCIMLAREASYRITLLNIEKNEFAPERYPVQIHPQSIATNTEGRVVYVLNYTSNTITAMRAEILVPGKQMDLKKLVEYRSAMINAYIDLLGGFLQYLKDCICDHLLIKCPTCDDDDKLFLGVVSVRNQEVSKICALSQRKTVKSFPTVGYWLSAIPVIPLFGKLLEMMCCAALPSLFANQSAPQPSQQFAANPGGSSQNLPKFSAQDVKAGIGFLQQHPLQMAASAIMKKVLPYPKMFGDFLSAQGEAATAPPAVSTGVHSSEFIGSRTDFATEKLTGAKVQVAGVIPYDPKDLAQNMARSTFAADVVQPNSAVTLVADADGVVRYYIPSSPEVGAIQTQLASSQEQIARASEAANQAVTLGKQLQDQMTQNTASATQALTLGQELKATMEATQKTVAQNQPVVEAAKALQDQVAVLKAQLASQQTAHDQAIAQRDQQIAQLTATTQSLQSQLQGVQDMKTQISKIIRKIPGGIG
jgi:hypothetical protein